jgi:hypothetical protein
MSPHNIGISNRETPDEEARGRAEHPQVPPDAPQQDDTARDDGPRDRQTSNKAGTKSIAQKNASKYTDRPAPPSEKVAGAFGKERSNLPSHGD